VVLLGQAMPGRSFREIFSSPVPARAAQCPAPRARPAEVLARLRERGHVLHRFGARGDRRLAEILEWAWERRVARERNGWVEHVAKGGLDNPAGGLGTGAMAGAQLDHAWGPGVGVKSLGVNHLYAAMPGATDAESFGTMCAEVDSVAEAGAGFIRHAGGAELTWWSIFGGGAQRMMNWTETTATQQIPKPSMMLSMFRDASYTQLETASVLFLQCSFAGIQWVPTLFASASSALNSGGSRDWQQVLAGMKGGKPDHNVTAVAPADGGWDEWYWYPGVDEFWSYVDGLDSGLRDDVLVFGRYGLCLHADIGYPGSGYHNICAPRKRLGLVAYGQVVGEWLAQLESTVGIDGANVIPMFELGNEMNTPWRVQVTAHDYMSERHRRAGAQDFAWFCAALALGVRTAYPAATFRLGEVASSHTEDHWRNDRAWLRATLEEGIPVTLTTARELRSWLLQKPAANTLDSNYWWNASDCGWLDYNYDDSLRESIALPMLQALCRDKWFQEALHAAWSARSPIPAEAGDLVSEVGLHWYHFAIDPLTPGDAGMQYLDQATMLGWLRKFQSSVVDWAATRGYPRLTWSACEIGFPASAPVNVDGDTKLYTGTSADFQAGMLLRLLVTARAAGARQVAWHSHMDNGADTAGPADSWSAFAAMGLRNDVFAGGASAAMASVNRYRRPAWFALARLARLFDRSTRIEALEIGSAFALQDPTPRLVGGEGPALPCIFRFTALPVVGGFRGESGRAWRYAYLAWLDQFARVEPYGWTLSDPTSAGFERYRLAPSVAATALAVGRDEQYPTGEILDWTPAGWDATGIVSELGRIRVEFARAEPAAVPLPVCFLCDAEPA
jgi:hypothetical protein